MEETAVTNTEPSISDLRSMLTPSEPEAKEAPAAAETPARTEETASEPDQKAAQEKAESAARGADGKFKKPESAEAEAGDEALPPNVQKRIAKAVKAQREAERKAAELEARLNGNQESRPAKETAPVQTKAEAPKAEDFQTYEEFTRALSRFEARQEIDGELTKQREAGEKSQREATQAARHKAFDESEVEARKTHPDYDDVTGSIDWPKTPAMGPIADYLLDTKNAKLMYQLGKQPAELARIAALPPVVAIAELGKFEAKLNAPPAPPAKKALPKPPAHVGGNGGAKQVDINDPDIDMGTFKRLFRAATKAS